MMKTAKLWGYVLAGLISGVSVAEDRIQLEGSAIIGNQESPKALSIVPWRPLTSVDVVGLELGTLLDEELQAIDRDVFKRRVELYDVANDVIK